MYSDIYVSTEIAEKYGLTTAEVSALITYALKKDTPIEELRESLWEKGFLCKEVGDYSVRNLKELRQILAQSESSVKKHINYINEELLSFSKELMDIMPNIMMEGTPYWYKCNKLEVAQSLDDFFNIYGEYSNEDIKDAVQRYVDGFNNDYTYMKLLRNFIIKYEDDGTFHSELASYLENK